MNTFARRATPFLLFFLLMGGVSKHAVALNRMDDSVRVAQHRLNEVFSYIERFYATEPDMEKLSVEAIKTMLKSLDPHSVFIPAKEVQRANEQLVGNFEGVGITFQINDDTIYVADVIAGGPSEKVGLQRGDRIVRIDGQPATGDSVTNSFVTSHLRGDKGTTVVVEVLRDGLSMEFHIVRDKIPIYSVDTYFMASDQVGYIRLSRFARTSVSEFRNAVNKLKSQGMTRLIFDLRGNSGGFLDVACALANELVPTGKLIVYTEGRSHPRQDFYTQGSGLFRTGDLVLLVDENSASASEIVSGAVQDWDRGTLIGRRTFGKGLVQHIYDLSDGSQIRLTTARYFTPSGRCIQKPYDDGVDAYNKDLSRRFTSGELVSVDSIHMPDSLKYTTASGRVVYGGGGIMPDIFIPMDTMRLSDYYLTARSKGLINSFPISWTDKHRNDARLQSYESYIQHYDELDIDEQFAAYATSKGVTRDVEAERQHATQTERSNEYLHLVLKAQIARDLFGTEFYYRIMCAIDDTYLRALDELQH